MPRPHTLRLGLAGLALLAACHIEDRTPAGSRQDAAAIQSTLADYYRAIGSRDWAGARQHTWRGAIYSGVQGLGTRESPTRIVPLDSALATLRRAVDTLPPEAYDVRTLRTDVRQERDVAAAWITVRRRAGDGDGPGEGEWMEHVVLRRAAGGWRIVAVARATRVPRDLR